MDTTNSIPTTPPSAALRRPLRELDGDVLSRRIGTQQLQVYRAISLTRLFALQAEMNDQDDLRAAAEVLRVLLDGVADALDSVRLFAPEGQEVANG